MDRNWVITMSSSVLPRCSAHSAARLIGGRRTFDSRRFSITFSKWELFSVLLSKVLSQCFFTRAQVSFRKQAYARKTSTAMCLGGVSFRGKFNEGADEVNFAHGRIWLFLKKWWSATSFTLFAHIWWRKLYRKLILNNWTADRMAPSKFSRANQESWL